MADNLQNQEKQTGLLEALWSFFGSMKTAIVLLLILAAASILGTVIQQSPAPGQGNVFLRALGLSNVYHSRWYAFLLMLIGINLTVCSIKRLRGTWRQLYRPNVEMEHSGIAKMQRSQKLSGKGTVEATAGRVSSALRKSSYHIVEMESAGDRVIYAMKGRISLWGPYLTHTSLLIIFAGAIIGNMLGFHGNVIIPEGQSASTYLPDGSDHEANLGFTVLLRKFEVKRDAEGNPTAFLSSLEVYDKNKLAAKKTIDVNRPLTYHGITFYQSDYGVAGMMMKIIAPNGETTEVPFELAPQDKGFVVSGEPFKQVEVGGKTLTVFVHNVDTARDSSEPIANVMVNDRLPKYKGMDAWTKLGFLQIGNAVDYKGYKVSLDRVLDYTGLQVNQNPGLPVVYSGFVLLMLGVFLSFYVVRSVIRIRISPSGKGASVTAGATCRGDASALDRDFARLRDALSGE